MNAEEEKAWSDMEKELKLMYSMSKNLLTKYFGGVVSREEAIEELLRTVYDSSSALLLDRGEVREINEAFKHHSDYASYADFLSAYPDEADSLNKLQNAFDECERQFELGKNLQPGTITECNYAATLAGLFGLSEMLNTGKPTKLNELPSGLLSVVHKASVDRLTGARYIYYKKRRDNESSYVIQYGNPAEGDASFVYAGYNDIIVLEFKEPVAKTSEKDMTYGEDGKLIPSEDIRENYGCYLPLIDKFNAETDIFSTLGHNYNDFSEDAAKEAVRNYFLTTNVDVLITADKNNELVAVPVEYITEEISDDTGAKKPLFRLDGSEIRPSGKNPAKVFTPDYLQSQLTASPNITIRGTTVKIPLEEVETAKERGGTRISRYKFCKIFFVRVEDVVLTADDCIEFDLSKFQQLKPTISMHLEFNATKQEVGEFLRAKGVIS